MPLEISPFDELFLLVWYASIAILFLAAIWFGMTKLVKGDE